MPGTKISYYFPTNHWKIISTLLLKYPALFLVAGTARPFAVHVSVFLDNSTSSLKANIL
ncbi:10073_t:CDS:2 [Ambispora gerdemannii]|uniref:10073_t:CDS:1 n=1 Tax=Ambispora gerdemannii TaxID=144530 RepID=A0A9N8W9T5_9GLOM|nr:10073_t:CDS:2 [Ambispora gerdemannii]